MENYNLYLAAGDEAITKRTGYRYRVGYAFTETNPVTLENNENMDVDSHESSEELPFEQNLETEVIYETHNEDWAENIAETINFEKNYHSGQNEKNLLNFIESPSFSEKISTSVDKTLGEVFFMILKYSVVNNLSTTATTNLFKLINTVFKTPILPDSRYIVDKLLNPNSNVEYHGVCAQCSAYVGELSSIQSIRECQICQSKIESDNPSSLNFFVLINPSSQISDLLNTYSDHYEYVTKEREHTQNVLKDIYDGKHYRRFVNLLSGTEKYNYVSAMFNTDGASKFKSSNCSIWPIFLQLNELPAQERIDKLVTCGLYFGKKKPDMTIFIDKFVDLINKVCNEGIICKIKNEERILKLYVLTCCADAVARPHIQGIKQFNGYYGCNWCLHPGVYAEGSVRYNNLLPVPKLRNHNDTIQCMLYPRTDHNDGIKHPSPLINLEYFDIIKGFLPDYLHSCLEGVAVQFTFYFLESLSDDQIKNLDDKMKKITATTQVSRLCRPISCKGDWKAKEWENFVLFYSVPLLSTVITQRRMCHWIQFVESLYILLKDTITIEELNHADELLHKFVYETEGLYGISAMTFNLHQMLHLSESVANWGPLWTNSTFAFESGNFKLLRAIKCSKGVTQQLVRHIHINHSLMIVENFVGSKASVGTLSFCNDILSAKIKNTWKTTDILYFGRGDDESFTSIVDIPSTSKCYLKIVKNSCLYESSLKRKRRSNNSFVQLLNGKFAKIIGFVVHENGDEVMACYMVQTKNFHNSYTIFQEIQTIERNVIFVRTSDIKRICMYINFSSKMFICPVPNLIHN